MPRCWGTTRSSDRTALLGPACLPASGSLFSVGDTTVACTAEDATGNEGSASFRVTVQDTTDPVAIPPADQTVEATGPTRAIFTYPPVPTSVCCPLSARPHSCAERETGVEPATRCVGSRPKRGERVPLTAGQLAR